MTLTKQGSVSGRESLSSRRAWIEILIIKTCVTPSITCRSPHGERGLKSRLVIGQRVQGKASLSSRRAWIEMEEALKEAYKITESLSSRRAWIEMLIYRYVAKSIYGRSPHGERGLKWNLTSDSEEPK